MSENSDGFVTGVDSGSNRKFSKADAERIRTSLAPMDFQRFDPPTALIQSYCDYYGLNFGGQQLEVQHGIGRLDSGEFQLVCHHFQVPLSRQRGTAFILHGYYDHTGIYSHLIDYCLHAGYSVVMFDLPGHGLSSGLEASIGNFGQYTDALLGCMQLAQSQGLNQPWVLLGQSTGGSIVMDALLDRNLAQNFPIGACLLLAPLLRPTNWQQSRFLFYLTRWFVSSMPRSFAGNSHDPAFLDFLRNSDPLQPRLLQRDWILAMIDFQQRFAGFPKSDQRLHIIQGSGDGTVDWRYNLPRIAEKFPSAISYMIADAGHHLVNEAQPYRDRVFSIIGKVINDAA